MASNDTSQGYGFGTFKGVFTPSILTILGVVMYLRFGWVLGNVGLFKTLLIVILSTAITFLTGLALASLATNMKVGGGGAYFMISRSLGLEAGAAVGLPLFFAQALGISFYIAGFSESLVGVFPSLSPVMVGVVTLCLLMAVVNFSADLALKLQFLIMAAIAISLFSFFFGDSSTIQPLAEELVLPEKKSFWVVFAVFFPAVTGIEAGIAMSGDLKDPAKSLPLGTLGAVLFGFLIYLLIPIFLSIQIADERILRVNSLIMRDVAVWGDAVLVGIWGASLSSAMGALLGAPRTLQALAQDRVIPHIIGKAYGSNKDPRIATVIAFSIGLAGILLGDLNLIAPVLSMFFLTSYGLLNISAGFEEFISSPSWRPKFKVSSKVNFCGALACFGVMLMINAGATFMAMTVSFAVFFVMRRRSLKAQWGDVRYGVLMDLSRYAITQLAMDKPDARTWKPNILVLSGAPKSRWYLIELADAISSGRSFMTVATVLTGDSLPAERVKTTTTAITDYLLKNEVEALVKVMRATSLSEGLHGLVRAYGFGPLKPNTVLLGHTQDNENLEEYVKLLSLVCSMERNLVIVRESAEGDEPPDMSSGKQIDVWWARKSKNAGLMLALAYQLKRSSGWNDARLVLKTVVNKDEDETSPEGVLREFIDRERLEAEVEVVEKSSANIFDDIRLASADADLVFFGMRERGEAESIPEFAAYYQSLIRNTEGLPPTAIVFAAEDVAFKKIFTS